MTIVTQHVSLETSSQERTSGARMNTKVVLTLVDCISVGVYRMQRNVEPTRTQSMVSLLGNQSRGPETGMWEQAEPELGFQLSNQDAQAGWGDVQCFRGAREASVLRHQQKSPELPGRKV